MGFAQDLEDASLTLMQAQGAGVDAADAQTTKPDDLLSLMAAVAVSDAGCPDGGRKCCCKEIKTGRWPWNWASNARNYCSGCFPEYTWAQFAKMVADCCWKNGELSLLQSTTEMTNDLSPNATASATTAEEIALTELTAGVSADAADDVEASGGG